MATTTHHYMDRGFYIEPACGDSRPTDAPDMNRPASAVTCGDCYETAIAEEQYSGPQYSEDRY